MRVGLRPAIAVLGVTASIALTGCSGQTSGWKFWESSSATPAESTQDAGTSMATARPASDAATPAAPAKAGGFMPRSELADVRFEAGRVAVRKADVKTLDVVAGWLAEHPGALVMIEGHTDDLGSRDENLMVGEKRAASIMKYLVAKGVARERITITSHGPDRPLCTDKTETCRAKNRRVRFLVKQP